MSLPGRAWRRLRPLRRALGALLLLIAAVSLWYFRQTSVLRPDRPPVVNDITGLNPVPLEGVIVPTTVDEIVGTINNINAALPASPCTIPIRTDLTLNRWCESSV